MTLEIWTKMETALNAISKRFLDMVSLHSSSSEAVLALGAIALMLAAASYLPFAGSKPAATSKKAQQAKAMREAHQLMERQTSISKNNNVEDGKHAPGSMQISQLWVYPVKSLRGCVVPQAMLTKEGFYLDRRFVLLQEDEANPGQWKHMAVSRISQMVLFHPSISEDTVTITYHPPGSAAADPETLEVPLEPENLERFGRVEVNMHFSPTKGYDLGEEYSKWFSKRFGFKVILAYWGNNPRLVLGNLPGKPTGQGPKEKNAITKFMSSFPVIGSLLKEEDGVIAFNDCAPYLVITEPSLHDVTARLPDGVQMDVTKFRANILLKTSDPAWDEDFWGELTIGSEGAKILLTGNCGRCNSLNVDYNTGESGTGRDGQVLKLLQKDRRVDLGTKYSPIFGRYGFASKGSESMVLRVGDEVTMTKRNEERTKFYWPGLST